MRPERVSFIVSNMQSTATNRGQRVSSRGALRVSAALAVDVLAAGAAALLVFRLFGAWSGVDTNPPVCSNAAGEVVSCSLTQPVLMLPTFVVVLALLVSWQVLRLRSRRG